MPEWITAISTTLLMLATIFLATAAWQAKKNFLQESLYNDSWELYKKWNDLKTWIFSNKNLLDSELLTKEKVYSDVFREKLDALNFLFIRVNHLYEDRLADLENVLNNLDSVWLIYANKQASLETDKYKSEILKRLTDDDEIASKLCSNIMRKMKIKLR